MNPKVVWNIAHTGHRLEMVREGADFVVRCLTCIARVEREQREAA